MSISAPQTRLDRVLDPVADCFSLEVARKIVDLKLDPQVQTRLDELAGKANQGELAATEREEYEEYVEALDLVGILKAKARLLLSRQSS